MSDRPVFLYAAVYDEIADAEADDKAALDLHRSSRSSTSSPDSACSSPC
jgi:hypothetical protein